MRVLARSGDAAFLVQDESGGGYVVDIETYPVLSERRSVDSLLGAGYWEPFEGDPVPVVNLVARLINEGEPLEASGWDAQEPARALPGERVTADQLTGVQVEVVSGAFPSLATLGPHTIRIEAVGAVRVGGGNTSRV